MISNINKTTRDVVHQIQGRRKSQMDEAAEDMGPSVLAGPRAAAVYLITTLSFNPIESVLPLSKWIVRLIHYPVPL